MQAIVFLIFNVVNVYSFSSIEGIEAFMSFLFLLCLITMLKLHGSLLQTKLSLFTWLVLVLTLVLNYII